MQPKIIKNNKLTTEDIRILDADKNAKNNQQYFPVFIDKDVFGKSKDDIYYELRSNSILARRYFYPLISQFPTYKGLPSASPDNLPVAERITNEVLCLPMYTDLDVDIVNKISWIIEAGKQ